MEVLKLNETPVRTSKNFNMNNIKLEDINIPNIIEEFKNIEMSKNISNNEVSNINLNYGIGSILINQLKEKSNKKIKIIIDEKMNENIVITFKFDNNNINLLENIEIIAEENSSGTIILRYETSDENIYYHNGIIRAHLKNNSKINIVIANLINIKSNNFLTVDNLIESNAKVDYTIIDFGGKNSITNYYSNLIGNKSDNFINTIYLGKDNQLFDLNYIAELKGEKSNINIEVQGALTDKAKKNFKGTIDFKKGCKGATGNENENCMLLSDTAKSLALPMLLCSEESVEGNHSSSAGKIEEKELFYIMSRGFEYKEAMKLIVRAKFNKILENINDKELLDRILKEIDQRLN